MDRKYITFACCLLALTISIWVWIDLFVFSTISSHPDWQNKFPTLLKGTFLIVFISLTPAALFTKTVKNYFQVALSAIALAPLPALLQFFLNDLLSNTTTASLNIFSNYVWIITFHCLIPFFILLIIIIIIIKYLTTNKS